METMTATIKRTTVETTAPVTETRRERATRYLLAGLRLALGWVFLWAFLDKLFGLGLATEAKNAWLDGGSPTKGFLTFGATGPFQDFYQGIAGAAWADWLFMIGLAAIGTALILGIGVRVAAAAGGLLLVMMWTAVLPPENNPFMDDHLIYAAVLAVLALVNAGDTWGLGRMWARLPIVQRYGWLR
ncbi:DoxX family membrane protein [Micromonospora sp. S4605]|uniref:DoxX family membrane protein n=1 Tax=Micromonospora sp. S4605 TaxID=1420897 RepID=UPI0018EE8B47|nr:DoxX family membrane protein [Micromonospora sp. S4605]